MTESILFIRMFAPIFQNADGKSCILAYEVGIISEENRERGRMCNENQKTSN